MDNCYTGTMLLRAAEDEALKGFELRDGFGADEIDFPLDKPLAVFECEVPDRLGFLLGYDDGLFGCENIIISVFTDDTLGGAYCETKAREICEAMLRLDREKMITGVRAEKYTYDRIKSAYKVMMRFFLRECIGTAEEAVV